MNNEQRKLAAFWREAYAALEKGEVREFVKRTVKDDPVLFLAVLIELLREDDGAVKETEENGDE
jgi:hypothetical protein